MTNMKIGDKVRIEGEIVEKHKLEENVWLIETEHNIVVANTSDLQLIEEEKECEHKFLTDQTISSYCMKCGITHIDVDSPKLPKIEKISDIYRTAETNIIVNEIFFKLNEVIDFLNNQNNE